MTGKPYTPTTETVRFAATFPNENFSLKGSDFDRWLATIEAAAEQRGAVKALRHEADNLIGHGSVWPIESVAGVTAAARKLHRRADEMEDKNE